MCTPIQRLAIGVEEVVKIGSGACAVWLTEIIAVLDILGDGGAI